MDKISYVTVSGLAVRGLTLSMVWFVFFVLFCFLFFAVVVVFVLVFFIFYKRKLEQLTQKESK